jgi:hypothetical protein
VSREADARRTAPFAFLSDADRVAAWAASMAAVTPVVVAVVRAVHDGWIAIGDNAFFTIRARDVLTAHHPLLGTWTSASRTLGTEVNNPGPLLFDVLAIPARLAGDGGVAAGVAALNVAAIAGIAVVALRRGGPRFVAAAMAMAAALVWSMGSELLFDPWQPHSLLLPFLCLLTLVWGLAGGDWALLPWAVLVASLIVQTHLSYALLVALQMAWGVAWLLLRTRRAAVDHRAPAASRRRWTVAAGGAALVCWAQPGIDQLAGEGNLASLARSATGGAAGDAGHLGLALGARLVAWVLAVPPFFGRPAFERALVLPGPLPSLTRAVAGLVVLVAALVAVAVVWRRAAGPEDAGGRGAAADAAAIAVLGVLVAVGTAGALPAGELGIAAHQFRWLWPIGAFSAFALGSAAISSSVGVLGRSAGIAAAVVAVVLGALAVPSWNPHAGPSADARFAPTTKRLVAQLDDVDGPVLFDMRGIRFAEPYSAPVLAALQARGIEFVVDDAAMVRQLGRSRRASRREARTLPRLIEREGDAAFRPPPGAAVVARVEGLSPAEKATLDALEEEVAGYIRESGLILNRRGIEARRAGRLPAVSLGGSELRDPDLLIGTADLALIVQAGLAPIEPAWQARFARVAELRERWNFRTVALFLVPPS